MKKHQQSPSRYAKMVGWRTMTDCEIFLGLGRNSMGKTAKTNHLKFRALVRGAWLEYCDTKIYGDQDEE